MVWGIAEVTRRAPAVLAATGRGRGIVDGGTIALTESLFAVKRNFSTRVKRQFTAEMSLLQLADSSSTIGVEELLDATAGAGTGGGCMAGAALFKSAQWKENHKYSL